MQSGSAKSSKLFPKYLRIWVMLLFSVLLLLIMSAFLSQSLQTLNEGAGWVAHTERVRFQLAKILQSLSDLGSGVAGYQITHDQSLFEPASTAEVQIPLELKDLQALLTEDTAQRPLLSELMDLALQRQLQTQTQRRRALDGDIAGVKAEISGGEGKRLMDASRSVIAQMQAEERHLLDVHSKATRSAYTAVAIAIWAAAALSIVLLTSITVITVRDSERLRRLQEELATTLRSVGDAVISTDAAGVVRFMNTVAEQLTGWSSAAAHGRPLEIVFNIVNEQTRAPVESPVAQVLRDNKSVALANHTVLLARDGSERPIEDSGAPIRGPDGELLGAVLVFRDATADRTARRALIESRDALRESDHRKDIFLATLSHELRNPLAPIRTATRVLETPGLSTEDLQRSRSIIARQVRHMASLLDDLLDISRITRGVLTLKSEPVDLHALMEAAVETAQPAIAAKGHAFKVEWPGEAIGLLVDPVRLTQVIANLLTNAAKYTKAGGHISLGARVADSNIEIYVRDDGIGIAAEMLPRVFDMFSQIDGGHEHSDGGIGIGLALVKGFVELHGGSVEARSAGLARGSEFLVRIPAALRTPAPAVGVPENSAPAPTAATRRVLIADDNRDAAEIMAMLLTHSGFEVQLAHTGTDALAMAERQPPDFAVLDIGMPGLSGYEVARGIRGRPWGGAITLIAVTGWGQEDDKLKAMQAGFDHHLTKPVDPNALERLMTPQFKPNAH
jgi:PAS domain S-box-containing protein